MLKMVAAKAKLKKIMANQCLSILDGYQESLLDYCQSPLKTKYDESML